MCLNLQGTSSQCAQDQSRTDTPFLALPPESSASTNFATESSASTNFATCASKVVQRYKRFLNLKLFFSNYYFERYDSLPVVHFENHIRLRIIYLHLYIFQIFGGPVVTALGDIFPESEFAQGLVLLLDCQHQ